MADTLEQQLQNILAKHGITPGGTNNDAYNLILSDFNSAADKDDFLASLTKPLSETPHIFSNFSATDNTQGGQINVLKNFRARGPQDYRDGMDTSLITFINRERAQALNSAFVDPYTIVVANDANACLANELHGQNQNTLITGAIGFNEDVNEESQTQYLKKFLTALKANNTPNKYNQIIVPLGLHPTSGLGHAVCLCIKGDSIDLIDQMGHSASFANIKTLVAQTASDCGFSTFTTNVPALSTNRHDCATVVSLVTEHLIDGTYDPDLRSKNNDEIHALTDDMFAKDKDYAQKAIYHIYLQNPVFRYYLESVGKTVDDFRLLPDDEKQLLIDAVKLPSQAELNPGGNTITPEDDIWKEDIRNAFILECQKANRTYQEVPGTRELVFQMGNAADKVIFHNTDKASVISNDVNDYILTIQTFRATGHDSISFGSKILERPELSARLYLACLKTEMPMVGQPDLESLKHTPEYAEIQQITRKNELRQKMRAARQELNQAQQDAFSSFDYLSKETDVKTAETIYNQDPLIQALLQAQADRDSGTGSDAEVQAAQDDIDNALNNPFSILSQLKRQRENARQEFEQLPETQALQAAKDNYQTVMTEAVEFTLGDKNAPEYAARKKRLEEMAHRNLDDRSASLVKRSDETDADFAARQLAVKEGRWEDTLRRKANESDADYQTRKDTIKANWKVNPDDRINDDALNRSRKITQSIIAKSIPTR